MKNQINLNVSDEQTAGLATADWAQGLTIEQIAQLLFDQGCASLVASIEAAKKDALYASFQAAPTDDQASIVATLNVDPVTLSPVIADPAPVLVQTGNQVINP